MQFLVQAILSRALTPAEFTPVWRALCRTPGVDEARIFNLTTDPLMLMDTGHEPRGYLIAFTSSSEVGDFALGPATLDTLLEEAGLDRPLPTVAGFVSVRIQAPGF